MRSAGPGGPEVKTNIVQYRQTLANIIDVEVNVPKEPDVVLLIRTPFCTHCVCVCVRARVCVIPNGLLSSYSTFYSTITGTVLLRSVNR